VGWGVYRHTQVADVTYLQLTYFHLATVLPAFLIGTYLMLNRKGTLLHRRLGASYMLLMMVTSTITLFMEAKVGPRFLNHFGFIHLLAVLTLYSVPTAYLAARRHDVKRHRRAMVATYVGALLIAGALAFSPGRFLHHIFFS